MRPFPPFRLLAGLLAFVFIGGCAAPLKVVPFGPDITPPRTIAVLPLDNQTNSVPGSLYVREVMHNNLRRKGYVATPLPDVDRILSDQLGISLGGQVTEADIRHIGETLGVDAVLTGTLQKFGTVLALYSEVEATFAMYETRSGSKIWAYHGYAKQDTALAQHNQNAVTLSADLVASMIQRGRGKPLQSVVQEYYRRLFDKMPNGSESPERGAYAD
ncbi:MAG: DUF799 family lipoprotein [Nitrospirae bacterium]|nr:DUF799 family lipoprotein [Nitrospirota bacterium]